MLTASRVATAHACEGSQALEQRDEKHPGQDEGVARHSEWEDAIKAGKPPDVLVERWLGYTWRAEVAFAIDLDTGKAWEIGEGIGRGYGELGPRCVAGTADAVGRGPNGELVIVDKKSFDPGVARAAVNAQLNTLALMACRAYGLDECEVAISHELRPLDVASLDFANLIQYETELGALVDRTAEAKTRVRDGLALTLSPGSHCRWCSAFAACPVQSSLAIDVNSGAAAMRFEALMPLRDDQSAARAYDFLKRVKMLSARLSTALYARAAERPFMVSGGRMFGKRTKLGSTKLDSDIAYNVVREKFGQEVADASVERKASQAGIKRGLEFVVGKGTAKALNDDVMKEIKARGGSNREESEVVEEYDAPPSP